MKKLLLLLLLSTQLFTSKAQETFIKGITAIEFECWAYMQHYRITNVLVDNLRNGKTNAVFLDGQSFKDRIANEFDSIKKYYSSIEYLRGTDLTEEYERLYTRKFSYAFFDSFYIQKDSIVFFDPTITLSVSQKEFAKMLDPEMLFYLKHIHINQVYDVKRIYKIAKTTLYNANLKIREATLKENIDIYTSDSLKSKRSFQQVLNIISCEFMDGNNSTLKMGYDTAMKYAEKYDSMAKYESSLYVVLNNKFQIAAVSSSYCFFYGKIAFVGINPLGFVKKKDLTKLLGNEWEIIEFIINSSIKYSLNTFYHYPMNNIKEEYHKDE